MRNTTVRKLFYANITLGIGLAIIMRVSNPLRPIFDTLPGIILLGYICVVSW